jgi:hypothetical protein
MRNCDTKNDRKIYFRVILSWIQKLIIVRLLKEGGKLLRFRIKSGMTVLGIKNSVLMYYSGLIKHRTRRAMRFLKSVLTVVLILGFVLFWGDSFVFAQTPELPKITKPSAALCNNITPGNPLNLTPAFTTDGTASNKGISVTPTEKSKHDFKISITWTYFGSKWITDAVKNGTLIYGGPISIFENEKKISTRQSISWNTQIAYIANKLILDKPVTLTYSISQDICYRHQNKNYKINVKSTNPVSVTLTPGQDPAIDNNGSAQAPPGTTDPNAPGGTTAPAGGTSGYDVCIQDPTISCGKCCAGLRGTLGVPTLEYVECWITCSLDIGLANFIDQIVQILIQAIEKATGLI